MIEPGETFRDLDTEIDPLNHLWIVVSGPVVDEVALVNFTTHRPWLEQHRACSLFDADDHPWLEHESCLAFQFARMWPSIELEERKRRGEIRQDARCSPVLLRRIQEAVLGSAETSRLVKAALRSTLGAVD